MTEFGKEILHLIEIYSGLEVNEAHRNFVILYAKKRQEKLRITENDFLLKIKTDEEERNLLINEAAINETYFFREEQQFDFLKNKYFPKHLTDNVVLWSAACSTGEEALSLYAMALSCGIKPEVYATDIDTHALKVIREGIYSTNSFRNDGKKYLPLLDKMGLRLDGMFELSDDCREHLHVSYMNLNNMTNIPVAKESVNIIFIRNVFIYFDIELRKQIIGNLAQLLKKDGLLFLSVNEIASVECDANIPLVKEHDGSVYYFRKVDLETKRQLQKQGPSAQAEANVKKRIESREKFKNRLMDAEGFVPREDQEENNLAPTSTSSYTRRNQKQQKCDALPESIEKLYNEFLKLIDERKLEDAKQKLLAFSFRPENTEHRLYMEAILANESGFDQKALQLLEKATIMNPNFWPAFFQLGMLQMRLGNKKECKKSLSSCIKSLKDYIKEEKVCYNSIVEQFSPSYFLTLCENYVRLIP